MVMTMEEVRMYGCDSLKYIDGNQKVFIQAFRELTDMGQKLDREDRLTGENLNKIQEAADVSEEPITMDQFVAAAKHLYLLGELPVKPALVEVVQVKKLTPSQQAWKEFRIFTDGHLPADCEEQGHSRADCKERGHSVTDCKARARVDQAYSKFLNTNLIRQMGNGSDVQDAVVGVGTVAQRQDKAIAITNDMRKFVEEYRRASSADIKRLSSVASNPHGYTLYLAKLDEAIAAGLI